MIDTINTVTVALFVGDYVLLLQRDPEEYPGHGGAWELIGGHVREGEMAEQAAIREVVEETGIIGISLDYAGVSLFTSKGQEAANMIYTAHLECVQPLTLSRERQAYHWTPVALALQVSLACKHSTILRDIIEKGDA